MLRQGQLKANKISQLIPKKKKESKKPKSKPKVDDEDKLKNNNTNVIDEAKKLLKNNSQKTSELKIKGKIINYKLDQEIKKLKSEYRANRRAYLFGDMVSDLDIRMLEENTKIKAKYENLTNLKERLRSKLNPNFDGYDSPIEALYSRQDYIDTYDNVNDILDNTQTIINATPIIHKGVKKGANIGIKGVKTGVNSLKNSAYIKSGKQSIKHIIKSKSLPTKGKIRFVPREADKKMGKILEKDRGYVDKFGNIWKKPKVANVKNTNEIHWDVQLSKKGKEHLDWLSNSGNHLNVSQEGIIHH